MVQDQRLHHEDVTNIVKSISGILQSASMVGEKTSLLDSIKTIFTEIQNDKHDRPYMLGEAMLTKDQLPARTPINSYYPNIFPTLLVTHNIPELAQHNMSGFKGKVFTGKSVFDNLQKMHQLLVLLLNKFCELDVKTEAHLFYLTQIKSWMHNAYVKAKQDGNFELADISYYVPKHDRTMELKVEKQEWDDIVKSPPSIQFHMVCIRAHFGSGRVGAKQWEHKGNQLTCVVGFLSLLLYGPGSQLIKMQSHQWDYGYRALQEIMIGRQVQLGEDVILRHGGRTYRQGDNFRLMVC